MVEHLALARRTVKRRGFNHSAFLFHDLLHRSRWRSGTESRKRTPLITEMIARSA